MPSALLVKEALLKAYGSLDMNYLGVVFPESSRTGEIFIEEMYQKPPTKVGGVWFWSMLENYSSFLLIKISSVRRVVFDISSRDLWQRKPYQSF